MVEKKEELLNKEIHTYDHHQQSTYIFNEINAIEKQNNCLP